jgi:hypothetical protein
MVKRKHYSSSSAARSISTEEGIAAAAEILKKAQNLNVKCAICGGLAMHLYGFIRATVDVDFVASQKLPLKANKALQIGGETYQIEVGSERQVDIDWIVRNDDKQEIYEAALANADVTEEGLPIITPEWMVILKYLAGRGKDQIDLLWLLREEGLVNRETVKNNIKQLFGRYAYWPLADMDNLFLEADVMKARDENAE